MLEATLMQTNMDTYSEIISAIIIAIVGAIAGYMKSKKDGHAKENVRLAKDNSIQHQAIIDLASLGFKAYAYNADTTKTQAEYDILMGEVKRVSEKYGDLFGVGDEIRTIVDGVEAPSS